MLSSGTFPPIPYQRRICTRKHCQPNKVCLWGCNQDNLTNDGMPWACCPGGGLFRHPANDGQETSPIIWHKLECEWLSWIGIWICHHGTTRQKNTRHNRISSFHQWRKKKRQCSAGFPRTDHCSTGQKLELPPSRSLLRFFHRRAARHSGEKKTYIAYITYYTYIYSLFFAEFIFSCWELKFVQYVSLVFTSIHIILGS